jgi:RNA polymerase sigma-70 factor (ECF subfamily)
MDPGPFDVFYRDGYARLVAAVGLVVGSRAEAEDAVDEALARAWSRVQRGEPIESLGAWVRVVALNLARGRLRRRAVERRARVRLAGPTDRESPLDRHGAAVDVRRALATLSRRQREVTVLFYFCDLPVREIATELRIDEGTVKSTLHKARAALAAVLADDDSTPEEAPDAVDA